MDTKPKMDGESATMPCNEKRIRDILKPLLQSMKLFGVYHEVHDVTSVSPLNKNVCPLNSRTKICTWVALSRFYSLTILILMWANLIRYAVAVPPVDQGITGRIILFVWFGLVALGDLVLFIACENRSYLSAFYKRWDELYQDIGCVAMECRGKGLSRKVLIGTVVGWIWYIFNLMSFLYLHFWTHEMFAESFMKPFPESTLVYIVVIILQVLAIGIYVFPIIFIVVTCHIVTSSFERLSRVIEKHIKDAEEVIPLKLDRLRRIHLHLCRAVSVLDRTVRLLVAVEYVINIPLACFIVYQLINVKMYIITAIVNLFWLSFSIISIVAVTLSCAQVHDAAHSPLKHIFEIRHERVTPEQSLQVTLFLSQLTGASVGFTIMGMMTLTKEVLLTLAGLYITYFFLLLQFRI